MRESKIKGTRYRYDPKTGKMEEIKRELSDSPGRAFRYHWAETDGTLVFSDNPPPADKEKHDTGNPRENRETTH